MTLVLIVVFMALAFEYINGFHDTANSIAMGVSTRALTPRMALTIAATMNLVGALVGTAVAKTISSGLVENQYVTTVTTIMALLGAIIWNLITWWFGLPSSSSHALVGGLVGATLATSAMMMPEGESIWKALIWSQPKPGMPLKDQGGLLYKVIIPMIASPIIGFVAGLTVMTLFYRLVAKWRPATVDRTFRFGQLFSGAFMGFSHGSNDAQKTMGIIALALGAATASGSLNELPAWLDFLHLPNYSKDSGIPLWIKITCAVVMAAGTAAGGWKIIKTMGQKMVKVLPINGFAADATGATVLVTAAHFGMPVSTTHAITTSIMGVGCARRWSALKLNVISRILIAWVLTLPVCALISWVGMKLWIWAGWAIR
jgi:inorganic phosphate transporter, PiT family